jgi:hypothetical protein
MLGCSLHGWWGSTAFLKLRLPLISLRFRVLRVSVAYCFATDSFGLPSKNSFAKAKTPASSHVLYGLIHIPLQAGRPIGRVWQIFVGQS